MSNAWIATSVMFGVYIGVAFCNQSHDEETIIYQQVQKAVTKCEAELPRNKHCVPVYTASIAD